MAEGGLDAQARCVAPAQREAKLAGNFGEEGVAALRGGLGAERVEEAVQAAPFDAHVRVRGGPGAHVEDLAARGTAAVVAETQKHSGVFKARFLGMCERRVKATGNLVASRPVPARLNAVAEDSSTGRSPPPERLFREREKFWRGTPEGERLHAGGGHDVRKPCGVSEGISLPCDARPDAEVRFEPGEAHIKLPAERPR